MHSWCFPQKEVTSDNSVVALVVVIVIVVVVVVMVCVVLSYLACCNADLEEMARKIMARKLKGQKLTVEPSKITSMEEVATVLVQGKLLISGIPGGVELEMLELFVDGVLGFQSQEDYTLVLKLPKAEMVLSAKHSDQGESMVTAN